MDEVENFQMTNWRANTRQICHRYRKNSPLAISTDVGKSRYWNYLASKSAFLEIPRLNILQTCPIDREIKLTCAGQSHGTFAHRRDRCNLSDMQHPMSKKIGHSAILIVILTSLTLISTGGIWRRESSHRIWESTWLLLRNLWRPRHWPPHPHHRQQLHQVLHAPETLGGGRRCRDKEEILTHTSAWRRKGPFVGKRSLNFLWNIFPAQVHS